MMLILGASNEYWRYQACGHAFIVVYFSKVFHYRLVQVGMFTLHIYITLTCLYCFGHARYIIILHTLMIKIDKLMIAKREDAEGDAIYKTN